MPAWTDRILRKGPNLRQLYYNSAPLKFSDHRPVYAAFECLVSIVDEPKREWISQDLYRRRKAEVGDSFNGVDGDETEDEDLIGYDAIEPGLPPASSDRQKWWLDNKQPARAQVPVPNGRDGVPMTLNPNRLSNPFGHSEEQDWISVSRSSSRASFSSFSSSPYEKVMLPNIMNSRSSSTMPRKLPGSETGSMVSRMGRVNLSGDHEPISGSPPLPPPRRQTQHVGRGADSIPPPSQGLVRTATMPQAPYAQLYPSATSLSSQNTSSTNGGSGRSAPPPVARKPAHLATGLTPSDSEAANNNNNNSSYSKPPLPARAATMGITGSRPIPMSNSVGAARSDRRASSAVSGSAGPSRPLRNAAGYHPSERTAHTQAGPVDLLDGLDEGGQDMGGWETLQPSTTR